MSTPDPSPTEEELEALRHDMLGVDVRKNSPHIECESCRRGVERLFTALRSARESARVATRERDEAQAQIEDGRCCDDADRLSECGHPACVFSEVCEICVEQGEVEGRFEAQLTDRDRMIAGLTEAIAALFALIENGTLVRDISRDAEPGWAMRQLPLTQVLVNAKQALSTSHPIAAAFEAQVARERDGLAQEISAHIDDARRHLEASIYEREDVQAFLSYVRNATEPYARATLRAHEETIGRLRDALKIAMGAVHQLMHEHANAAAGADVALTTVGTACGDKAIREADPLVHAGDAIAAAPPGEYEQRVRREALEEAAKKVETLTLDSESDRIYAAAMIRAL